MKLVGEEVGQTAGRNNSNGGICMIRVPCAWDYTNPSLKPAKLGDAL